MASKTYIPQLITVQKTVQRYAKKWQVQLQSHLSVEQYDCLTAVINAVITCLVALNAP